MQQLQRLKRMASGFIASVMPIYWKELHELSYWKRQKKTEGRLANDHYAYFFTTHFGLDPSFYSGKFVLDIGCGPRGSLEWADMASRRIGVDPLAMEYLKLGANNHRMEYIASPSETIPLSDGECDIVSSFNSLDHVESVEKTIREIKRITRPCGVFLLLVEVNHPPTACEPHQLTQSSLIRMLEPEFKCDRFDMYRSSPDGIYDSIHANAKFPDHAQVNETAYMSAMFRKMV
jgi:ubiquinone/menaquinone biosynthesis C-methylase UbiE